PIDCLMTFPFSTGTCVRRGRDAAAIPWNKGSREVSTVSSPTHTEGVILAGQHTWRDSTLDVPWPRPVLPVGNRPLASYAARWLYDGGVRDVVVCVNRETRVVGAPLRAHVTAALKLK